MNEILAKIWSQSGGMYHSTPTSFLAYQKAPKFTNEECSKQSIIYKNLSVAYQVGNQLLFL